ncbi:hypothetical protein ACIP6P_29625 [Streptomyces sp. NPDC088729]|uniref:hypothetical protein n=1 Tax=unclassified Streptomyces TaxID=2593676 RepID=UPI000F54E7C8|nr:hypothetical protein [Streptomyces sp. ADI96-02]
MAESRVGIVGAVEVQHGGVGEDVGIAVDDQDGQGGHAYRIALGNEDDTADADVLHGDARQAAHRVAAGQTA